MNVTFEEFKRTCYHTEKNVVVPLLSNLRIDKIQFFKKGKYAPELLEQALYTLYEANIEKFK